VLFTYVDGLAVTLEGAVDLDSARLRQISRHSRCPKSEGGSRHPRADRQSQLPRDRDHGVSFQRRCAGARQEMAAHESPRTTKLYDRTKERLRLDEVERIRL
jgi:hypothetical protein